MTSFTTSLFPFHNNSYRNNLFTICILICYLLNGHCFLSGGKRNETRVFSEVFSLEVREIAHQLGSYVQQLDDSTDQHYFDVGFITD